MKSALDHLPAERQDQLRAIAGLVQREPGVAMLILFGSFARGDWVADPETGYRSDLDLAVVLDAEPGARDEAQWLAIERRARELSGDAEVSLIVHGIKSFNHEIRMGSYLYADIVKDGVMLYDSRRFELARPKALNAEERLALGERDFASWFDSASVFFRMSRYAATLGHRKHAAFLLHQATERFFHTATLVFTGYKHQSHDLDKLAKLAGAEHPLLLGALPRGTAADDALFSLLRRSYIEARYSLSFRISEEELHKLQERVVVLAERVRAACLKKLGSFRGPEAVRQDLPAAPRLDEPLLAGLPPPPEDPAALGQWAQSLTELAEQRGELRGEERGRAEGLREGERAGEERGRTEGERRAQVAALLLVLRARGFAVSTEVEARIQACTDTARLTRWIERAAQAASLEDALGDSTTTGT